MKSITRLLLLPVLGLVLVAATATAVAAQDDAATESHRLGALWAKGSGSVELDVGYARLGMVVNGDVTIIGPAELDVRINSARDAVAEGGQTIIVLDDFTGRIAIHGSDFQVSIEGDVHLHGVGYGDASFVGTGWWKTRHHRGMWPSGEPRTDIEFGAAA